LLAIRKRCPGFITRNIPDRYNKHTRGTVTLITTKNPIFNMEYNARYLPRILSDIDMEDVDGMDLIEYLIGEGSREYPFSDEIDPNYTHDFTSILEQIVFPEIEAYPVVLNTEDESDDEDYEDEDEAEKYVYWYSRPIELFKSIVLLGKARLGGDTFFPIADRKYHTQSTFENVLEKAFRAIIDRTVPYVAQNLVIPLPFLVHSEEEIRETEEYLRMCSETERINDQ
jgi:hypothetical protein